MRKAIVRFNVIIMCILKKINRRIKLKNAFLIVVFTLISLTVQSQGIEFISLVYSTAVKPVNATVKVTIHLNLQNTYKLKVESVSFGKIDPSKSIDKEIIITAEQFIKLVKAVQNIQPTEIIQGTKLSLLDGDACSITYGTLDSSISYQVNTPNYDTDRRKLNNFLNAFELILRAANLDPKLILG